MICDVLVFRKFGEFGLLDPEPVLGSALCSVAVLLLRSHVRPADPVFVLGLALQMLHRVALHLPCNLSWTTVLSDPLLPRDAFPQQGEGEEHGGQLFLEDKKNNFKPSLDGDRKEMTGSKGREKHKGFIAAFEPGWLWLRVSILTQKPLRLHIEL